MKDIIKRDTEINWNKAVNFIPKLKEVVIYDCEDGPKVKIGDGIHRITELSFIETTSFCVKDDDEDQTFITK